MPYSQVLAWLAVPTRFAAVAVAQCEPEWLPGDPVAAPLGSLLQRLS
jgi:hypothetical protein